MKFAAARFSPLVARGLAIALVVVLVLAVRVVLSSRAELAQGDALRAEGQLVGAVSHYRRAASWYTPGSPFANLGLARLSEIGLEAEEQDDVDLALGCYRSMRSAILSARSFYTPNQRRLRYANERIADLTSGLTPAPMDLTKGRPRVRAEHYQLLSTVEAPNRGWTITMLVGFAMWVFGALGFAQRAVDQEDRFVSREVRRWGTVIVVGLGLFVLGLSFA